MHSPQWQGPWLQLATGGLLAPSLPDTWSAKFSSSYRVGLHWVITIGQVTRDCLWDNVSALAFKLCQEYFSNSSWKRLGESPLRVWTLLSSAVVSSRALAYFFSWLTFTEHRSSSTTQTYLTNTHLHLKNGCHLLFPNKTYKRLVICRVQTKYDIHSLNNFHC